ncbi:MAG: hypothetical protein ABIY51_03750 [Ferruginibacter sp.]
MSESNIEGKVTFINHEKKYAIIEYIQGNKKKTATGSIDAKLQKQQKDKKLIKKTHHFLVGDVVSFDLKLSPRGDRMIASNIQLRYNNALDLLIQKSATNNKFIGYLKEADGKYFVKEIDSYLFFPVHFSPWQVLPTEAELNEAVNFSLHNIEKKEKITAELFENVYIPEFHMAVKHFKSKSTIEATVTKITPHGIYLDVINNKILGKISPADVPPGHLEALAGGSKLYVIITHLTKSRIVVEPVVTEVKK